MIQRVRRPTGDEAEVCTESTWRRCWRCCS